MYVYKKDSEHVCTVLLLLLQQYPSLPAFSFCISKILHLIDISIFFRLPTNCCSLTELTSCNNRLANINSYNTKNKGYYYSNYSNYMSRTKRDLSTWYVNHLTKSKRLEVKL